MNTQITFDKLKSKDPKVKYSYAKELLKISSDNPHLLYPHYDYFVEMSNSDSNVLKWTAIDILGNLSVVDDQNKSESLIEDLYAFLQGGHLITCNHTIYALGEIAKNKSVLKSGIIETLLKVPTFSFNTEDCKNIAIGKVIDVLKKLEGDLRNNSQCIEFVNTAAQSNRASTQKKARNLLAKFK